jgi:hypothetical protein
MKDTMALTMELWVPSLLDRRCGQGDIAGRVQDGCDCQE